MSFAKQTVITDIEYNVWATRRLLAACAALTPEEQTRNLGLSHHSVLETLHHIYGSERFWTDCILAHSLPPMDEIGAPDEDLHLDLAQLQRDWPILWNDLEEWLAPLSEEALNRPIPCRVSPTKMQNFTPWEIVRHSVNHATQHRGQIVGMLRAMGKQPPNVDIMGYYLSKP